MMVISNILSIFAEIFCCRSPLFAWDNGSAWGVWAVELKKKEQMEK